LLIQDAFQEKVGTDFGGWDEFSGITEHHCSVLFQLSAVEAVDTLQVFNSSSRQTSPFFALKEK
jgi:hypothetical protein